MPAKWWRNDPFGQSEATGQPIGPDTGRALLAKDRRDFGRNLCVNATGMLVISIATLFYSFVV